MIENAQNLQKLYSPTLSLKGNKVAIRDDKPEYLEGVTQAGVPLLFSCIKNEPENPDEPWMLEKVFDRLLKSGVNPNQRYEMIDRMPLMYALDTKK